MKDYSQFGEQHAVLAAVKGIEAGRALDIGAWHPKEFSNTRALYEAGWSLTCIEPSPGPMLSLLDEYGNDPRVMLIQAAIFPHVPGLVEMHITDDAVSTANAAVYEQWRETAKFRGKLMVPAISLEQIANWYGGFDMVNLDAEGLSADLFLQMMALGWGPKCIVVEHDGRMVEMAGPAAANHYVMTLANQTNAVWVRR